MHLLEMGHKWDVSFLVAKKTVLLTYLIQGL